MELTLHQPSDVLLINSYSEHAIMIGENSYDSELFLTTEQVLHPFKSADIHQWSQQELDLILTHNLDIILFGCGKKMHMLPMDLQIQLSRTSTGYESMTTEAACRTYNILASEGRKVGAVFKL